MPAGAQQVGQGVDDSGMQAIHALRQRLHDQVIAVAIDDQRREQVGLAVHQAVGRGVERQRRAEGHRAFQTGADERGQLGRLADREHPDRDLRAVAEERGASRRARGPNTSTTSPPAASTPVTSAR